MRRLRYDAGDGVHQRQEAAGQAAGETGMSDRTVFHDPSGRRRRWLLRLAAVVGGLAIIVSAVFVLSLVFLPVFPTSPAVSESVRRAFTPELPRLAAREQRMRKFLLGRARQALLKRIAADEHSGLSRTPVTTATNGIIAAFYATWQETGLHSLRANAGSITHLLPVWLTLSGDGSALDLRDWDPALTPHNLEVVSLAREHHMAIWPVLSNAQKKIFDPERAHRLLVSPEAQHALATSLRDWLRDRHFQGVNVDFENLTEQDNALVPLFLARLREVLAPAGLGVSCDIQSTDETLDWKALAAPCDFVIIEGYDQHAMLDTPGPISAMDWYRDVLDRAVRKVPPAKLVIGLGNYAYDWPDKGEAESMTYLEAVLRARDRRSGEAPDSVVNFDPAALNPTYNYDDDSGREHEVWLLDGVTAGNQMRLARAQGVRRFALWVLGSEDPSIWSVLGAVNRDTLPGLEGLKTIEFPYDVEFLGDGEVLSVAEHPKTGHRDLDVDPATGIVTDERYVDYPTSFVLRRTGYQPHELAITFDDGPYDPWTSMILDSLRALNIRATFFVIGQNADREPDLIQRMWDEGHEIGNHSFTHPNLGECSPARTRLELVATQRSIESILGRSTRLFRPPYNADAEPTSAEEVKPIEIASDLGYLTVGEYLDPQDWELREETPDGHARDRTAADIAVAVIDEVHSGHGNTILLHDGGGDRSRTAAAMRLFVTRLRAEGFRFVTVSELLQTTRMQVMPPVNPHDELLIGGDRIAFNTLYGIEAFLHFAFLAAIGLGAARVLLIVTLALIARRRERRPLPAGPAHSVSVLIAAYNEHAVIVRTVQAVLASEPPPIEVIVVDDGSTDGTAEALAPVAAADPRVRLVRQANQGKAAALNHALSLASGEIVVCLDADTLFVPDTIERLARHFTDPRVAAVAGNVRVGNRVNLLTYWQAIEYISSQNLDRRAWAFLNAVPVVPGACGAWRRQAMRDVGGLRSDTLAEDMDLTWRLRRAGWRIANEPTALAYTEAPETIKALLRQRFRWAFGTLQCLWKHRSAMGRFGAFGALMLPSLWLFQILFPVLSPIVDVQVLITLLQFAQTWLAQSMLTREWQPMPAALAMLNHVAFMYAFFLLIELLGATIAFILDRERLRLLWWVFWKRFVYRQIMYAVVLRSVQTAMGGLRASWGKLERRGTAKSAPHAP
jgi:poly-beta-1,6 N-acetyl-D-glucosamine synthase